MIAGGWEREDGLRLLERALSATQNGVMITDATEHDDPIVYVNCAFEKITGYAAEEVIGRNPRFLQAGDSDQPALDGLRASRRSNDDVEWTGVLRNYKKDGALFYNELAAAAVHDGGRRVTHHLGVLNDVTERKLAEEALREGERRFRQLFENSADALFVLHPETREVVDCNREACRSLGYPREELLGLRLEGFASEVLSEEEKGRRGPDTPWRRALTGEPGTIIGFHENEHRRKDGTTFPVEVGVGSIDYAGRRMILASCRDVTERKRAEEALRESEERYRAVVEQTAEGIYLLDVQTRYVVEANAAFAGLLGYAPEELPGMSALDFVTQSPEEFEENVRRALEERRRFVGERRYRRKDGSAVDVEVDVSVIHYGGREVVCAAVRDATERKRFEEVLRKRNEYLVALHETALGLVDRLDLKDMLDVVLARAAALLGASDGYVFLAEPGASEVPMTVVLGVYARYAGRPHVIRRGEGFGGRVWESGEPLVVNDYASWPGRRRVAGFEVPRAVAGVPIKSGPRVMGVLALAHTEEGQRFEEEEVEVLRRFAAFAAIALHNAELYDQARRELAERERAEEALREGQARLAEAQRIARVGSWEYAVGEDEAHWSDELYRIFGHDPHRFVPTPRMFFKSVHPDDRKPLLKKVHKALREGKYYGHSAEFRIVRPDGEARAVHARYEVIREDEAGRPVRVTGTLQDVTERKALEERLEHQAFHDPLTGLPNRALFTDRLEHALARTERSGRSIEVLFLDLDNFKYVNDSLGHETGDRLLAAAAGRLKGCIRPADTAARLGGDEFAVLLEGAEDAGEAARVAERIVGAFREPFDLGGREVFCGTSVGVASGVAGRDLPEDLLRKADLALYEAKHEGKARHALFDPEAERRSMRRLELENGLRRALERDEFGLRYQPVVSLETGRVVGLEALVRWEHPERGLLSPAEFVPLAEEVGMIVPIGRWVLGEACRQAKKWHDVVRHDPPPSIGVNLSARQLSHPDLIGDVEGILRETGLYPGRLTFEVTESVLVEDAERHAGALRRLKALGVRFAIDDFGTGYSSLSYLRRLPAGMLKLDGSFVEGIGEGAGEDEVLLEGVIGIAHGLGLEVCAEGVETEEQAARLRELGCDMAQGNHFSAPLPGEEASRFLASNARG